MDEIVEGKLEVICDDLQQNPQCAHGPTLLFVKNKTKFNDTNNDQGYFACSAYRSLDGCSFHLNKSQLSEKCPSSPKKPTIHQYDIDKMKLQRKMILSLKPEFRSYCHVCNVPVNLLKNHNYHKNHKQLIGISDELLKNPTKFLRPLSNDKAEAQYFFNENTLKFLVHNLQRLHITKIVCIGTPRLHEYIQSQYNKFNIQSILLDFDHRFMYFNDDQHFALYNMFNNYFFEGKSKENLFENFLKLNHNEMSVLIITDPPFGCRTEPLINTLKIISKIYQKVNNFHNILPIFWIFPYFMEHYIRKNMPEMEMIHYKINYTNHESYSNDKKNSRKYGSPVRLFTNIGVDMIELPKAEGYKFCIKCNQWTGIENIHCDFCQTCPSKNGEMYRHCTDCGLCVKPNYKHCDRCQRCTQIQNHNCREYQKNLSCWICRKRGHVELKCNEWLNKIADLKMLTSNNKEINDLREYYMKFGNFINGKRYCLLCTGYGHNESVCKLRQELNLII